METLTLLRSRVLKPSDAEGCLVRHPLRCGFRVVPWDADPSERRLPARVPWDAPLRHLETSSVTLLADESRASRVTPLGEGPRHVTCELLDGPGQGHRGASHGTFQQT